MKFSVQFSEFSAMPMPGMPMVRLPLDGGCVIFPDKTIDPANLEDASWAFIRQSGTGSGRGPAGFAAIPLPFYNTGNDFRSAVGYGAQIAIAGFIAMLQRINVRPQAITECLMIFSKEVVATPDGQNYGFRFSIAFRAPFDAVR